jgi:23S rRNA pseudouridine1911/1915/1917 synthase
LAGRRLDALLAELRPEISRSLAAKLIRAGRALLDGRPFKPSLAARPGQILSLRPPEPESGGLDPTPGLALDVLHSDPDLLVINKPPGLVVHPGAGSPGPTLASALLAHDPALAGVGPPTRPGLVHRLDKDTSGVLAVARNQATLEFLGRAFASRLVDKSYLALVGGAIESSGRIDAPIDRHPVQRKKMRAGSPGGKPASTIFRVLRRFPATGTALVHLRLLTGRTHQARVHLASIGAPILADPVYGRPKRLLTGPHPELIPWMGRQLLHARRLGIPWPDGVRRSFRAPWPADLLGMLAALDEIEAAASGRGSQRS